ncbi:MAG: TolC family outer membrane protein [Xanthomonadales bacterium]|nr:TolC family outer membrane protein [Gammaproteobacteria bacterium]MBT8053022.1 TolC family outer membrane protein [Gammaproteobacteria bacterium]NND57914.1 TolC family outer membrane protein [Xanthomonadales bacterium]NNK50794.1 TolC family outer membrane protein [Xanthomonadales bacterium]
MSINFKLLCLVSLGLLFTSPVSAVDLVGVHDLAAKNDPRLRAAESRREATSENRNIARANLFPQIGGGASLTRGNSETTVPGLNIPDSDIDNTNYGLDLRQSLYRQANYESLDIARGQISQAEALYALAYQDFLLRVSERYFLVLTLSDGVIFAEAEEKAFQRQFEQAEQRFEVGLTAVTDVHEARASYDNARARAIVARNDLADAKEALVELTGEYFEEYDALQEVLPLVEPDPINADEWVDLAMQSSPAVLQSRAAVDVADANMRLARSGHYPTLDLIATYDQFKNNKYVYRDFINDQELTTSLKVNDAQVRLVLDIPIYEGGRVTAQTRQARHLLDATGQDLDEVQRGAVRQTQNAYRAVLAGIEQVEAFRQASISAESALEATQAGFEVGTRTIVDVLIAEQRKYQAQRDNSVARHAYIINHLRLKAVAGLLKAEDLRVVNQLLE